MVFPLEIWYNIFKYMPLADLMTFSKVSIMMFNNVKDWILYVKIDKKLTQCNSWNVRFDYHKINYENTTKNKDYNNLANAKIIWVSNEKDKYFTKAVTDMQPRNINKGLGFNQDGTLIWVRGPINSRNKVHQPFNKLKEFNTYVNIFVCNDIFSLLNNTLKEYELTQVCDFIDSNIRNIKNKKVYENRCIIS